MKTNFNPDHMCLNNDKAWIPGMEGNYAAGKDGIIYTCKRHAWDVAALMPMKPAKNNHGYNNLKLIAKRKSHMYAVQSLMAMAWLGLEESDLGRTSFWVVTHINGDKTDNSLPNIKIMPRKDALTKYYRNQNGTVRRCHRKPVSAYDPISGETKYFVGGRAASIQLHGDASWAPNICLALNRSRSHYTAYGYVWNYITWDEYNKATGSDL